MVSRGKKKDLFKESFGWFIPVSIAPKILKKKINSEDIFLNGFIFFISNFLGRKNSENILIAMILHKDPLLASAYWDKNQIRPARGENQNFLTDQKFKILNIS